MLKRIAVMAAFGACTASLASAQDHRIEYSNPFEFSGGLSFRL